MNDTDVVRTDVIVDAPVEEAFRVFTERFAEIKPASHNFLASPVARTVMEPVPGGRAYDQGEDGSQCQWGRIRTFEPPSRLVFAWDIDPRFQVQTDPHLASEVEVTFTAEGPERTQVVLEHRDISRHGPGWQGVVAMFASPQGWPDHLQRFATLFPQ